MALESRVLSTAEFKEFARGVVPFLHVTSRVQGEPNPNLLGEKGGRGFPYVVAMDAEGRVTAMLEDRTVEGFGKMVEAAAKYAARKADRDLPVRDQLDLLAFDLQVKNVDETVAEATVSTIRERDDLTAGDRLALIRFELGTDAIDLEKARRAIEGLEGLSAEQKKEAEGILVDREIMDLVRTVRSPEAAREAGAKFAEMWKAGKEPNEEGAYGRFYSLILDHALAGKDPGLFEKALGKLRAKFGDNPNAARFFEQKEAVLEKLKEEAAKEDAGGM